MNHGTENPTLERFVKSGVASPSMVLIPADLASIAIVRAAIRTTLGERAWDDDATQRIVLVVSEAVANAVEHGSLPGELIEIAYQVGDHEATVRVLDSGGAERWSPPAAPVAAPPTASRGRGLAIIHALAQRVEYRPAGRGTEVRLEFARLP